MIQDYIALDLETTGLNPARDHILEIGAVKVKNGAVDEIYSTLVDCKISIPPHITALTGISNEMLEAGKLEGTAKEPEQAVRELVDFCAKLPLLGHNILFDYSFVKQAAVNLGIHFEKDGVDTLKISRKFLPDLPSRSLEALCSHYQIMAKEHHRAVEDALSAAELYRRLADEFENGEMELFLPQKLIYRVKKQSPITKFQKAYLIDLVKYHRIVLDMSIDSLTKSEASRMIDRILSAYGKIKR